MTLRKALPALLIILPCLVGVLLDAGAVLEAARQGLELFVTLVLPTSLPFFVLTQMLMDTPAVTWAGRALGPVMRPLFGCPGATGFSLIVGLLSGYPNGARCAAALYDQGALTDGEALPTVALCSTGNPAFILNAVGVGMLGSSRAGLLILLSHYGAVLLCGILTGGPTRRLAAQPGVLRPPPAYVPLGQSLARAVGSSTNSLVMVGGFIVFFSVLNRLAVDAGLLALADRVLGPALSLLGLPGGTAGALLGGALEISAGCRQASVSGLPLSLTCAVLAALVTWGGLSVQAQIKAFWSDKPLNWGRLLLVKMLQGAAAFGLCLLLGHLMLPESAPCLSPAPGVFPAAITLAAGGVLLAGAALLLGRLRRVRS